MHLLAWGHTGVAGRIEADMALADRLADLIAAAPALELWHRRHRSGELAPGRPRPCRCPCPPARRVDQPRRHRRRQLVPLRSGQPAGQSRTRHHRAVLNALDPSGPLRGARKPILIR